ncbi:hypothetical protein PsorP6_006566 [Peronosclerospora sorghi]|uniref:Uncharacterized protein n=1 Tax=Peronosclerospora sorghi TaxID=230839 RepID=A0ACC0W4A6_9STRA|nr:hypothetical protein PsorP6_006566 [Peronosclerospora sorghi]
MEMNTPSKVARVAVSAGFVSFFDFILEANGIRLVRPFLPLGKISYVIESFSDTRKATPMELIAQSEDRPMQLRVWNVKSQTTRELQLTPSSKWTRNGLIGVTILFDLYEGAEDELIHVLLKKTDNPDDISTPYNVAKSSPAERAGLRAGSDYLLVRQNECLRMQKICRMRIWKQ